MAIPGTPDALVSALEETKGRLAAAEAALQQVTAERDEYAEALMKVAEVGGWQASAGLAAEVRSALARLRAEGEALRAALKVFAAMSAMDPPESVPLNEWLPAITGARALLNDCTALARAATAREGA